MSKLVEIKDDGTGVFEPDGYRSYADYYRVKTQDGSIYRLDISWFYSINGVLSKIWENFNFHVLTINRMWHRFSRAVAGLERTFRYEPSKYYMDPLALYESSQANGSKFTDVVYNNFDLEERLVEKSGSQILQYGFDVLNPPV